MLQCAFNFYQLDLKVYHMILSTVKLSSWNSSFATSASSNNILWQRSNFFSFSTERYHEAMAIRESLPRPNVVQLRRCQRNNDPISKGARGCPLKANTNKEKLHRFQFRLMEMRRNSSSQIQSEPFTLGSKPHRHIGQRSVPQIHLEPCSTKCAWKLVPTFLNFEAIRFWSWRRWNRLNEALCWANFLPFIEVLLEPVYATMTPASRILVPWREKHNDASHSWPFLNAQNCHRDRVFHNYKSRDLRTSFVYIENIYDPTGATAYQKACRLF